MSGLDGAHWAALEDSLDGTPNFADPHRRIMDAAQDGDVAANAYDQYQRIEHDADADVDAFTQTWGNLDERSGRDADAADADGASGQDESLRRPFSPTPR